MKPAPTTLRGRLETLLMLNPKGFRTDTMATRLGVKPQDVSGNLLPLRAAGEVTTTNDGGEYVIWKATLALRERVNREAKAKRLREQEEQEQEERVRREAEDNSQREQEQERKVKAAAFVAQALMAARAEAVLEARAAAAEDDSKVDEVKTFILWSPQSNKPPKVTYPSYEKAVEVQATMCKRYPGQSFHVCAVLTGRMVVVEHKLVEV